MLVVQPGQHDSEDENFIGSVFGSEFKRDNEAALVSYLCSKSLVGTLLLWRMIVRWHTLCDHLAM
jgi:hypothetical protein